MNKFWLSFVCFSIFLPWLATYIYTDLNNGKRDEQFKFEYSRLKVYLFLILWSCFLEFNWFKYEETKSTSSGDNIFTIVEVKTAHLELLRLATLDHIFIYLKNRRIYLLSNLRGESAWSFRLSTEISHN